MNYNSFKHLATQFEMEMFDDYCRNRDCTGSNLEWHFKKWYALDWTARHVKERLKIGLNTVSMANDTCTCDCVGLQARVDELEEMLQMIRNVMSS